MHNRLAIAALTTTALAGCGNPYAVKVTDVAYNLPATNAAIDISDLKLYKREALINERREEVAYLNGELEKSKTANFEPEIARDLETISSLSLGLGLKFDRAAGEKYRDAREISDLEQDIRIGRLQAQLDQLERDNELLQAQLEAQTQIRDTTLGQLQLSNASGTASIGSGSSSAVSTQLAQAIADLRALLVSRLEAETKSPRTTTAKASPIEVFQDRAALRSLLNHARNQANLDELHDADGSALLRLSFTATLPPAPNKRYHRAYSELAMTVAPPLWTAEELENTYQQWLGFINEHLMEQRPSLFGALAAQAELFQPVRIYYSTDGKKGCMGLLGDVSNQCKELLLAAPASWVSWVTAFDQRRVELNSQSIEVADVAKLAQFVQEMPENAFCDGGFKTIEAASGIKNAESYVYSLFAVRSAASIASRLESQAARSLARRHSQFHFLELHREFSGAGRLAPLAAAIDRQQQEFGCYVLPSEIVVPERFAEIVTNGGQRLSVYNIEPREVVQHVSTIARAAEAIGLAAAASGAIPTSGFGADGNISFARSATGKVDALERIPLIQSFARANDGSHPEFGWRFGPRAVLDPKGKKLLLEHHPRSHELSANVVVPGWWPYLQVNYLSQWSPYDRANLKDWTRARSTRIKLTHTLSDMNALTALLAEASALRLPVAEALQASISACTDSDLEIRGDNIWRASMVMIGGRRHDENAIRVAPDLGGIIVTARKSTEPMPVPPSGNSELAIRVMTPSGAVPVKGVQLKHADVEGKCNIKDETPASKVEAPTISAVDPPSISVCHPNPGFNLTGTKLAGPIEVLLGASVGTIVRQPSDADPTVRVGFTTAQLKAEAGAPKPKLVLRLAKGVKAEKEIELIVPTSCPGS